MESKRWTLAIWRNRMQLGLRAMIPSRETAEPLGRRCLEIFHAAKNRYVVVGVMWQFF